MGGGSGWPPVWTRARIKNFSHGLQYAVRGFIYVSRRIEAAFGSARGPVTLAVFKTVVRQASPVAGAFDSHTLPPLICSDLHFVLTASQIEIPF